jgi:hypothetical protein
MRTTVSDPLKEASRGRSERTQFIALSGVMLLVGVVYYLA